MQNSEIQKKKGRKLYSTFSKWSLAGVAFFFSLFSFGNFAYADTILDISTGTPDTHAFGSGGSSIKVGQSFVVTDEWEVTEAQFRVGKNGSGHSDNIRAVLCSYGGSTSNPCGTQIGVSDSITSSSIPAYPTSTFTSFSFDNIEVGSGTYFIYLERTGSLDALNYFTQYTSWDGVYDFGQIIYYRSDNGGEWVSPWGADVDIYVKIIANEPPPSVSGVSITSPTAQTYAGNPITFSGLYTNLNTFNQIEFELSNSSFAGSLYFPPYNLPYTSVINQEWSFQRSLGLQGNYTIRARLYDTSNGSSTPWTSSVTFGLGTTTIATSTQNTLPGAPLPLDCETFDIACYIKNAVVWLFYPDDAIEDVKTIYDTIQTKSPFVFVYQVAGLREELFGASSTPQTISMSFKIIPGHGTSTLELISKSKLESVPYAGLVKNILTWILYLMAVEYIYYRVIRAHDKETPQ